MKGADAIRTLKATRAAVDPARLAEFAGRVGSTPAALVTYGIGWDADRHAWTLPMFDGASDPKGGLRPCGFRVWSEPHKRWGVLPESENGLFLADDFVESAAGCEPLGIEAPIAVIVAGDPAAAAVARSVGCRAIGRPGHALGIPQTLRLFCRLPAQEVVVVGQKGGAPVWVKGHPELPGVRGALELADRLISVCRDVRVLMSEPGQLLPGPTALSVQAAAMQARRVDERYMRFLWERYDERIAEIKARPSTATG